MIEGDSVQDDILTYGEFEALLKKMWVGEGNENDENTRKSLIVTLKRILLNFSLMAEDHLLKSSQVF